MKKLAKVLPLGLMLPGIALAQANLTWFDDLAAALGNLVDTLIPIVIAIGLLFFIWGLVQFIAASGDEAAKDEGKRKMIWGVIALFVIVAVWGLVDLLASLVGVQTGGTTNAPTAP
jgi:uncharacterized membrane protein YidH (DUF202 family)